MGFNLTQGRIGNLSVLKIFQYQADQEHDYESDFLMLEVFKRLKLLRLDIFVYHLPNEETKQVGLLYISLSPCLVLDYPVKQNLFLEGLDGLLIELVMLVGLVKHELRVHTGDFIVYILPFLACLFDLLLYNSLVKRLEVLDAPCLISDWLFLLLKHISDI